MTAKIGPINSSRQLLNRFVSLALVAISAICWNALAVAQTPNEVASDDVPADLNSVVTNAFKSTHDGWSSDEVILHDQRNRLFIDACKKQLPEVSAAAFNQKLINLRKAGKLKIKTTKTDRASVDSVAHIAEIAARSMHDRHAISTDQIMTTPKFRAQFNEIAKKVSPDIDLYLVRKAAFKLRKTRRLRPELIARIADWGREINSYSASQVKAEPATIAAVPGIYIFRDKTGYLYIGQTDNLKDRLATHLDESHNQSLANYLGRETLDQITIEVHAFDPDSAAKKTMVRRAYESELIASRKPRFNVQP